MQPNTPDQMPPAPQPQPVATPPPVPQAQPQQSQNLQQRQTPMVTMSIGDLAVNGPATGGAKAGSVTEGSIEWQAKEYITADRNPIWYVGLGVFVVATILLDIFVLKTFFTVSALAIVIAAVLVVMHVRPPRMINYKLDDSGLLVDDQMYPMSDYRAFGVLYDGKENSIHLIPVKRFRPSLQVYFPVESGEALIDYLGTRLPMEELRLDFVDRIVRFFRL